MKYAQRDYVGKNANLDKLETLVEDFFKEEGFRLQSSKHPNGYIIQAKKGGIFRTLLAGDRAYFMSGNCHIEFKGFSDYQQIIL